MITFRRPVGVVGLIAGVLVLGVQTYPATSLGTPAAEQATSTTGAALARGGNPHGRLLPDLTPLKAVDVSIQRSQHVRKIRFQAGLANIGIGPMEVRPDQRQKCPVGKRHASQIVYRDVDDNGRFRRSIDTVLTRRSAGCMVFHPQHNHWHFEAASRYILYRPGQQDDALTHARKMSFCLRDSMRVPARYGTFNSALYYRDCGQNTPQGISRGWVDVYASYLTGQAITIPRKAKNGIYCLAIRVDPLDELLEGDETNNVNVRALRISHRTQVTFAKDKLCRTDNLT